MGLEQLKRSLDEKMNHRHAGVLKQNKKPLMERCRRRKINNYLEELKHLVLSALNKEVSLYNKMEKADILDMAVRYIKAMRTNHEAWTASYRRGNDYSTTLARSHGVTSPIPLQPHAENIIYDNLCQPSTEKIPHSTNKNDNCLRVENYTKTDEKIPSQNAKIAPNGQFQISRKENMRAERNEENTMNCETPRTAASARIWRPW